MVAKRVTNVIANYVMLSEGLMYYVICRYLHNETNL